MLGPVDFARITHDLDGGIGVSTPREQTRAAGRAPARRDPDAGALRTPPRRPRAPALPRPAAALARLEHVRAVPRPRVALWVGSKNGELDGIRADVAIVRTRRRARSCSPSSRTAAATCGRRSTSRGRSPSPSARPRSARGFSAWTADVRLTRPGVEIPAYAALDAYPARDAGRLRAPDVAVRTARSTPSRFQTARYFPWSRERCRLPRG